jgi:uncharacterized phage protein (TIGR02220 family)
MAKADIWMPLYIGDYLADTTRLTTEQHGAYLLLIMDYWRNGSPPDDDSILANITKSTLAAWKKIRPAVVGFFEIVAGRWVHSRIEKEIAEAQAGKLKAQAKAQKAAEARWSKDASSNASSNAPSIQQAMLKECPSPSPSPKKSKALSDRSDAEAILEHLNEKAGRSYRPVKSNISLIKSCLSEGATPDECRAVIDARIAKWRDDPKMNEYLRPATIFAAKNFAQYVGELGQQPQEKTWE